MCLLGVTETKSNIYPILGVKNPNFGQKLKILPFLINDLTWEHSRGRTLKNASYIDHVTTLNGKRTLENSNMKSNLQPEVE